MREVRNSLSLSLSLSPSPCVCVCVCVRACVCVSCLHNNGNATQHFDLCGWVPRPLTTCCSRHACFSTFSGCCDPPKELPDLNQPHALARFLLAGFATDHVMPSSSLEYLPTLSLRITAFVPMYFEDCMSVVEDSIELRRCLSILQLKSLATRQRVDQSKPPPKTLFRLKQAYNPFYFLPIGGQIFRFS